MSHCGFNSGKENSRKQKPEKNLTPSLQKTNFSYPPSPQKTNFSNPTAATKKSSLLRPAVSREVS